MPLVKREHNDLLRQHDYGCGYWLCHVSVTAQWEKICTIRSSTSHVSVSESSDSEQPTESRDLPGTASFLTAISQFNQSSVKHILSII